MKTLNKNDIVSPNRKMGPEELRQHLMLGTRSRTFTDRKKEKSRNQCRGRVNY